MLRRPFFPFFGICEGFADGGEWRGTAARHQNRGLSIYLYLERRSTALASLHRCIAACPRLGRFAGVPAASAVCCHLIRSHLIETDHNVNNVPTHLRSLTLSSSLALVAPVASTASLRVPSDLPLRCDWSDDGACNPTFVWPCCSRSPPALRSGVSQVDHTVTRFKPDGHGDATCESNQRTAAANIAEHSNTLINAAGAAQNVNDRQSN